jgi:hypothetical protein
VKSDWLERLRRALGRAQDGARRRQSRGDVKTKKARRITSQNRLLVTRMFVCSVAPISSLLILLRFAVLVVFAPRPPPRVRARANVPVPSPSPTNPPSANPPALAPSASRSTWRCRSTSRARTASTPAARRRRRRTRSFEAPSIARWPPRGPAWKRAGSTCERSACGGRRRGGPCETSRRARTWPPRRRLAWQLCECTWRRGGSLPEIQSRIRRCSGACRRGVAPAQSRSPMEL